MADTANLLLPLMEAAQSQKHVTHNEALLILDAVVQLSVKDRSLTAPPGGAVDGDRYIVGSGATGAWDDKDLNVAVRLDGAWTFLVPKAGWMCWVEDDGVLLIWDVGSTSWINFAAGAGLVDLTALEDGSITKLGVNTSPDDTNRLAVKTTAALFSHDDVSGSGTGDLRLVLNKSASNKDAGFILQDGFSARALFGLLADDNTTLKTSPDGSTYKVVFTADKTTGGFDLAQHAKFQAFVNYDFYVAADIWTKVGFNDSDHDDRSAFASGTGLFTAPQAGYYSFGAKCFYKIKGANAATGLSGKFYKNGSAVDRTTVYLINDWGNVSFMVHATCLIKLAAGDTVGFWVMMDDYDGYVEANNNLFWGARIP